VFGIGWTEFVLVALVLLVFVGPRHLPGMLKKFVEIIGELKSASREFRTQIEEEIGDIESPAKMVRNVGRDLIKDMPSPYEEMQKAEEVAQKEVQKELGEIEADLTNSESKEVQKGLGEIEADLTKSESDDDEDSS
jgi:sec-independent protein translocase protein TatB